MREGEGASTNGSNTHPLMPRVTSLFARFSRGLPGAAFNLESHLVAVHLFTNLFQHSETSDYCTIIPGLHYALYCNVT